MKKKVRDNIIVIVLIILTVILTILFQQFGVKEYSRYSTDTIHYERAKVVEVSDEEVEYDEGLGLYLGKQVLQVEMLEGEEKGEIIEVTNYLTNTHSVYVQENTRLIINADRPETADPYYTIYNYDRSLSTVACAAILVLAIFVIGGRKGLKSIAGLVYSMFLIIYFMLPAIYSGYSPIAVSMLCAVLCTAVTLLLLNGQSSKTASAILSTTIGLLCSLVLFIITSALLHINGSSSSDAEGLILTDT